MKKTYHFKTFLPNFVRELLMVEWQEIWPIKNHIPLVQQVLFWSRWRRPKRLPADSGSRGKMASNR